MSLKSLSSMTHFMMLFLSKNLFSGDGGADDVDGSVVCCCDVCSTVVTVMFGVGAMTETLLAGEETGGD